MKDIITNSTMFGIVLSLLAYLIGLKIKKLVNNPFANPLFIGLIITVTVLILFDIPYDKYYKGASVISLFLSHATAVLGISIYRQLENLKKNFLPVVCGCIVGSIVSIVCSITFCKLFGLSDTLIATMIPRAATSPIAMEISLVKGGMVSVTVAMVIFSGIMGAVLSPILVKILKMNNKVAVGVAIGTSSSAAGTSKAIEMGETEGAMSGLAVGITGLATVIFALLI